MGSVDDMHAACGVELPDFRSTSKKAGGSGSTRQAIASLPGARLP